MADLYETAQGVLVWLGQDEAQQAKQAFRIMDAYVAAAGANSKHMMDSGNLSPHSGDWYCPQVKNALTPSQIEALADIYSRRWFYRVWTLQKVGVAAEATAFCGVEVIPLVKIV